VELFSYRIFNPWMKSAGIAMAAGSSATDQSSQRISHAFPEGRLRAGVRAAGVRSGLVVDQQR
jgi:hypothetical protein